MIDPEYAARITGYAGNAAAIPAFEQWCSSVPILRSPSWLDLLYWEHRVGSWAAILATALDTFSSVIFPYCSRSLLCALLGTDPQFRVKPYALHRAICAAGAPDLLPFEFNDSWPDRMLERLPWKLRIAITGTRRLLHRW